MKFKIFPSIQHELYLLKNLYLAPLKEISRKLKQGVYAPELSGSLNPFYYSLTKFSEAADDYSFFSNSIYIKEVRLELNQDDIIAHELGHALWRFFTEKDNQLTYSDFFSKIEKTAACLDKIHARFNDVRPLSSKLAPFAHDFETLYTSEDFADLIAAYYLKHARKKITWNCSSEKAYSKHYFPQTSFISSEKDDEHASKFFRLFLSHINQGKDIPRTCKEQLEQAKISEDIFTPCLDLLEPLILVDR